MAKIFIDAGHGGRDSGAVGNGLQEKHVVMKIARYTRDHLLENYQNADVRLSRTGDSNLSLSARTNAANNWGADVFVSIHINAGGGVGYEDFIYSGSVQSTTRSLQDHIHKHVAKNFTTNRGQKRANFYVLRNTRMPAVLTENGFIDNTRDANFLKSETNLRNLGEAHAEGIADFLKLRPKATASTSSSSGTVKIQTGGLTDENLLLVIDYFRGRGWYGEIVLNWKSGNPRLTSGGLSPAMRRDYEAWLEKQGFYYRVVS